MPILYVNGKRRGLRIRGRAVVGNPGKRVPLNRQGVRALDDWAMRKRTVSGGRWEGQSRVISPQRPKRRASGHTVHRLNPGRKQPAALARYWKARKANKKHRRPSMSLWARRARANREAAKANPARRRKQWLFGAGKDLAAERGRRRKARRAKAKRTHNRKRSRRARRSTHMAKGSRKRSRAMKRYWASRKRAGKVGRIGRTRRARKRSKGRGRRRQPAALARYWKAVRAGKARKPRRRRGKRRARRTSAPKRRRRRRASRTRKMSRAEIQSIMRTGGTGTLRLNPGRRRRRRRARRAHAGYTRRRRSTRRRRRSHGRRRYRRNPHRRRSHRRYRRNPGNMLLDLAKSAIPVLLSLYGARMLVSRVGPMIPGVSALGSLQGPALAVGSVLGAHFATRKIGFLAKHRTAIMTGVTLSALDSLFRAFAPASIQGMLGMGDYVAVSMGDYVAVGATPLREDFTLSDYVGVGGDGVSEELGLEEELGVDQDLGAVADGYMGGLPGGPRLLAPVPTQAFVQPVPARSFTKQIPQATAAYDNPNQLYGGIFGGKFGG